MIIDRYNEHHKKNHFKLLPKFFLGQFGTKLETFNFFHNDPDLIGRVGNKRNTFLILSSTYIFHTFNLQDGGKVNRDIQMLFHSD